HLSRLPERVQIDSRLGAWHAMNQLRPLVKSLHHATENPEVLRTWRFEIHGDMDIGHTESRPDAPLFRQRGNCKSQTEFVGPAGESLRLISKR
ncbi:MAG: hypothetical protein ACI91J_000709, partial [Yoonia sp.]